MLELAADIGPVEPQALCSAGCRAPASDVRATSSAPSSSGCDGGRAGAGAGRDRQDDGPDRARRPGPRPASRPSASSASPSPTAPPASSAPHRRAFPGHRRPPGAAHLPPVVRRHPPTRGEAVGLTVDFAVCDDTTASRLLRRILRCPEDDDREATPGVPASPGRQSDWAAADLRWPLGAAWAGPASRDRSCAASRPALRARPQPVAAGRFRGSGAVRPGVLAAHPEVRDHWAERYDLVQVDEIQDTHLSEYEVVATLARQVRQPRAVRRPGPDDLRVARRRPRTGHAPLQARLRPGPSAPLTDNHRATRTLIRGRRRLRRLVPAGARLAPAAALRRRWRADPGARRGDRLRRGRVDRPASGRRSGWPDGDRRPAPVDRHSGAGQLVLRGDRAGRWPARTCRT